MKQLSLYEANLFLRLMHHDVVDLLPIDDEDRDDYFDTEFNGYQFGVYVSPFSLETRGFKKPCEYKENHNLFFNINEWIKLNPNLDLDALLNTLSNEEKEKAQVIDNEETMSKLLKFTLDSDVVFFSSYDDKTKTWGNKTKPCLLLNDVFGYACADAESFDINKLDLLIDIWNKHDYEGVIAYASYLRNWENPIQPRITEKYLKAVDYVKSVVEST